MDYETPEIKELGSLSDLTLLGDAEVRQPRGWLLL